MLYSCHETIIVTKSFECPSSNHGKETINDFSESSDVSDSALNNTVAEVAEERRTDNASRQLSRQVNMNLMDIVLNSQCKS